MSRFNARIELHGAQAGHHNTLHKRMEASGFSRLIPSNAGGYLHLQTAEYYISGNFTVDQVFKWANDAAGGVGLYYSVFVAEWTDARWIGLAKAA